MKNLYKSRDYSTHFLKFFASLAVFFVFAGGRVSAQLDTEFWFAPPELTEAINPGTDGPRDRPIQLVISTLEKAAKVEILKPADPSFATIVENIPANSTRIVNLTPFINGLESKPENTVLNTGLFIRSTQSISAYYEIKSANNTDLFALKGLNANGKKFFVPFQTRWNNSLRKGPGGGFYNPTTYASFDIVATNDSTFVTVTPSKDLVGHLAGQPFTFMLNRGQVYSCRAADRFGVNHPGGSIVESTKPVAVTMKDDMLQFDINEQAAGADIAGDQLIPVEFLGTDYVLVKGGLNGNNDRCYILATEDETVIRFNGSAQAADTLNAGEQFELVMTNPSYFLSTNGKKVAVLHISGIGDQLAGAVIPSLSCTGTNRIGFTRTTSNTFIINVITKLSAIGKFTLNGNPSLVPASAFTAIQGGNGWAFARITLSTSQVPAGTTLLLQNSSNELFHLGVTNYAAGVGSNYGYFSNFSKLNLGGVKNVCTGDTALLDAGPAKTYYLWNTGDTSRTIETLIPGRYWVTTFSGTECPKSDTVTVRFYTPNFDLGVDDTICIGGSKLLEPDGVFTYKWQDGSTATTYLVTQPGLYWAQVADFQGCSVRDSVNIFASPRPITPTVSGSDTVCAGNSVALSMNLVSNAFYNWYDPNGNRIPGRNIVVNTATQPVGAYKGAIKVKGCESFYDTAYVGLKDGIPVDLGKDTVLCFVSGSLLLDPVAHEPGFQYLWNNGSTDTNLVVTSSGSYSVRVTDLQGCTSFDTINVTFQGPAGNVVLSGPNNFCENEPAVFGVVDSPGTTYTWTGPNGFSFTGPTISIDQIQISQAGIYSVTPSLNTCIGTSADKTITVNPFPIVDLGKDSSACGTFSLLLDPVNGGSQGLSFLWNNGSTDSSITATTQGTYSVTVSNGACSATDEMVITFGVGPQTVTFTGSRTYCEGQNASFGVVPNDGETYSWTGPNGFTATGASINLPAVTQNQAGIYFVTPSLPGCSGAQSQTNLTVNSVPQIPGMKDTSFCAGSTIILDPVPFGNGETFYTWNTGSTDSTLTVGTVGKYSVIIDNGFCKAYDTVLVGTRPLPSAPTFFGNNQACLGSDVEFGVQQVVGQTHAWTGPGGFNLIGDTVRFQNINNTQFGSYSVVAILNNCASANSTFTLNQLSTPQIQLPESASICSGNSIVLDPGNFGSGITYLWSNGSTDSTLLVTQPGLVTVTVSNGTCSATDQVQIETGSTPAPLVISGNPNVCAGSSINLSVNPENGVDVTWSGPNGFTATGNNINVNNLQPNQSGNYIASQVLEGCAGQGDTSVVNILLIPSPDLPQNVSVCGGIAVELDPIPAGAGFTYLWSTGSVDSAISVSTAGLVKVTVFNQFCSASDSVLIIISETPSLATISGTSQNCSGTDLVLNANAQTGTSLSWTGPNGFTATGSSITINNIQASQAGEYILSQELSGCPGIGDSISIVVSPTPAPDLGNQVVVCSGTPVLLDPGLNGSNFTYLWNTGSTDSSITVSEGGKYFVTVTQGICSGTDSIDVIVGQNPETIVVSGPSVACEGSNVVFTSNASTGTQVNWTGPAGFTSSGSSITINNIQILQSGLYILEQSLNGCAGIGDSISITVSPSPKPDLGGDVSVCDGTPVQLNSGLGNSGNTFVWNTGSTDSSIIVSASGTYSVTVSNGNCSSKDSVLVQFGQTPSAVSITGPPTVCAGSDVVLSSNAGSGVSLVWSGPNGFSSTALSVSLTNVQQVQAGEYILSQSLNGCDGLGDTLVLAVFESPVFDLGDTVSVCDGTPVQLNSGLGNSGNTFIWNTGSTDSSIIVSASGTYSVTVSNGNCSSKDSVLVQFGQTPSAVSITGPPTVCAGSDVVLSSNAGAGVSLVWSGPNGFSSTALSVSLTNVQQVQAGEYILSQSLNGCDGLGDTLVLAVFETPVVELGADVSICGGIPVVLDPVAFGSSGFSFIWSTGSTDSSIVVNQSGKYSVVVNNGICSSTDSVLVTLGEIPSPIVITGETVYCSGSDALISSNAQAGVSLVWSGPNGFTSNDPSLSFTNLQPIQSGSYILSQSLNGCPGTGDTLNISVLTSPQADLGQNASICDGSPILLDPVTSGNGFTYLWSTGSTDSSITVNQTGEYIVTVSNQICQSIDTILVSIGTTPAPIVISGTPEACQGTDITFSTNASAGVTVNWTGPSNFSFTGSSLFLAGVQANQAGTYFAVPSDNGCVGESDSIELTIKSSPQIELGQTVSVCNGSQVTLDPIVGAQGLTFQWSNGSTDSSIVVSTAGIYSVVVSDGGFCPATDSIEVIDGVPPPSIPIAGDSVYCLGSTAVFAMPNLGQISYSWSGPAGFTSDSDTLVIPNLTAANSGIYTVTPSLGNCPGATSSINLIIGPDLQINLGNNDTICGNEPVLLDPLNGAAWYTYQWNIGSTDSVILATESGVYSVTIRNQGCVKTDSVELTFVPLPSTVTISGNASYCVGTSIDLSIQGAEPGVQYVWTGPVGLSQTGDSINIPSANLGNSGTYQVTPSKGACLGTPTNLDITVYQSPQVNLGPDIQSCQGNTFTLDPTQNGAGYIYLWSTGSSDSSINVNSTGQYSVEVSNGTICKTRDTINIEFFVQPVTPVISGDFIYCEGENAQFAASLQTGVNVSWTGPNGFSALGNQVNISGISVSQSGYFKALAFSPGCVGAADSVLIQVSGSPSLELGSDTTTCSGVPVVLSAVTGSGLNYQWTGGATTPTIAVSGSGTYYLTVTNAGLCSATDSIGVTIKPSPEPIEILSGSKSICSNETVIFSVVSRDNEVYNWTGPFNFSEQGDSIQLAGGTASGGTYTVTADRDGCKGSPSSVTLGIKPNPTLSVEYPAQVCKGVKKAATATASDGSFILWSNLVSGPANQLSVGQHWVSATLNGCSVRDTFLISNAGPLAAFTTNPDSVLEVYKDIKFIDQSVNGLSPIASWNWNLGFAGQSTDQNPNRTYNFEGLVDVSLVVTDQAGCSDTASRSLLIGPPVGWFIPNLITPNTDEKNDLFIIRDLEKFPGTYLRIVNRWGKVETEVNDYKNDWSGENLEDGIYYYNIKRGVDGQIFSGFVELKR